MRDKVRYCGHCDGLLVLQGTLGGIAHYKCRNCGIGWSRKIRKRRVKV